MSRCVLGIECVRPELYWVVAVVVCFSRKIHGKMAHLFTNFIFVHTHSHFKRMIYIHIRSTSPFGSLSKSTTNKTYAFASSLSLHRFHTLACSPCVSHSHRIRATGKRIKHTPKRHILYFKTSNEPPRVLETVRLSLIVAYSHLLLITQTFKKN